MPRSQEEAQVIADKVADALFAAENAVLIMNLHLPALHDLHVALGEAQAALIEDGILAATAARDGGQKGGGEEPEPHDP